MTFLKAFLVHRDKVYPTSKIPTMQILSDFIVKHRGVFTVNTKDALENIDQVEAIVFSSYDACTKRDPEDPQKRSFVAQVRSPTHNCWAALLMSSVQVTQPS